MNLSKKILALCLSIAICISILPVQVSFAASSSDIVSVANNERGVTSGTKYRTWFYGKDQNVAWCAIFVSWCVNQAGISTSIIPKSAGVGPIYTGVLKSGGTITQSPQAGDLIFYWSKSTNSWAHIGIMTSGVISVQGNIAGKVYQVAKPTDYILSDGSKNYKITYVHPNYSASSVSRPNGENTNNIESGTGSATTGVADTITSNSAILRGSISTSGVYAKECGMYFGTSANDLTKLGSDSINTYGTTMYYSTDKYIQPGALKPNTTYYYRAYVIVDGKSDPYWGLIKSFKTLPASTPTPTPSPSPMPTPTPTQDPTHGIAFPIVAVGSITSTSAHVVSTCSYTATRPSSVGVYLGTSTSNMTKRGSDTVNHSKNPFDIWYDLSGLTAGTTYYYKFYAIVDGVEIVSGTKSFTTTDPTAIDLSGYKMSGITASDITANSVKLSATCSYTSVRPSSVGVYLGTTPGNMAVKGSDNNITHNKNPFDIWYNLSGLSAGTTYYYRFYTVVSDKTLLSDIKTFTTNNVDIEIDPLPNPIGTPNSNSNVYNAITDANGYKTGVFDSADTNNRHQLFSLDYGTPVTVYADTEAKSGSYRWVLISYNGTTGYVNVDHVKKVNRITLNTAEPYYATATTQQVVRGDPLTGFYTNGTLKSGDTVLVNPQKQVYSIGSYTWVYVQSDSVSGYVNLNLLKKAN